MHVSLIQPYRCFFTRSRRAQRWGRHAVSQHLGIRYCPQHLTPCELESYPPPTTLVATSEGCVAPAQTNSVLDSIGLDRRRLVGPMHQQFHAPAAETPPSLPLSSTWGAGARRLNPWVGGLLHDHDCGYRRAAEFAHTCPIATCVHAPVLRWSSPQPQHTQAACVTPDPGHHQGLGSGHP